MNEQTQIIQEGIFLMVDTFDNTNEKRFLDGEIDIGEYQLNCNKIREFIRCSEKTITILQTNQKLN